MPHPPLAIAATETTRHDDEPFHALWAAVIEIQIRDALRSKRATSWGFTIAKRNSAVHWLLREARDFYMVCDLAGLEPETVRQWAQKTLTVSPSVQLDTRRQASPLNS